MISREIVPALQNITLNIPAGRVTAIMGPSGCGKSTLLRAINLIHEIDVRTQHIYSGNILLDGEPILSNGKINGVDVALLRKRVGMIYQEPTVFPMTIYDNIAFGISRWENLSRQVMDERVRNALEDAGLFNEVKDRLNGSARALSGGQQQRLCIARTMALNPEVILMDEPTSNLDPMAIAVVEDLMDRLQQRGHTIAIVTHNVQQAARVSDFAAVLIGGKLIEFGRTEDIFIRPRDPNVENFLTGRALVSPAAEAINTTPIRSGEHPSSRQLLIDSTLA